MPSMPFQTGWNGTTCASILEIFTRKPRKASCELIAAVVTRKDVYGGSADLQRHMIFTSGLWANHLQEQRREEEVYGENGKYCCAIDFYSSRKK